MSENFHDVKVYGPDGKIRRVINEEQLKQRHWKFFSKNWQEERTIQHQGGRNELGDIEQGKGPLRKIKADHPAPEPSLFHDYRVRTNGLQESSMFENRISLKREM